MKLLPYAHWYGPRNGGFIRWGKWSVAYVVNPDEIDYVPLSERYGTTRTWKWRRLRLRRTGQLHSQYRSIG